VLFGSKFSLSTVPYLSLEKFHMEGTRGRCTPICLAARGDFLERLHKNLFPKKSKEQFVHDAIVEPLIVVLYILSSIFIFSTFAAHGNGQYGVNRSADWTLIDCTYFTAQTMSTVGYGDISPASKDGPRIFAVWMVGLLCCDGNGASAII
jgi:hypothetical protein